MVRLFRTWRRLSQLNDLTLFLGLLQYGGGYHTGALCVGDSSVTGTKRAATADEPAEITVGLLSLVFMEAVNVEEILLPMLTWQQKLDARGRHAAWELTAPNGVRERDDSIFQLINFTSYHTVEELLEFVLTHIPGESGTVTVRLTRNGCHL
jgi:hypothetical protein